MSSFYCSLAPSFVSSAYSSLSHCWWFEIMKLSSFLRCIWWGRHHENTISRSSVIRSVVGHPPPLTFSYSRVMMVWSTTIIVMIFWQFDSLTSLLWSTPSYGEWITTLTVKLWREHWDLKQKLLWMGLHRLRHKIENWKLSVVISGVPISIRVSTQIKSQIYLLFHRFVTSNKVNECTLLETI